MVDTFGWYNQQIEKTKPYSDTIVKSLPYCKES